MTKSWIGTASKSGLEPILYKLSTTTVCDMDSTLPLKRPEAISGERGHRISRNFRGYCASAMSEATPIISENSEVTAGEDRRGDVYESGGRGG